MKATQELMNEHEGILAMLGILESIKNKVAAGEAFPGSDMERIVEFLVIFVDKCHHGKEEEFLFPALEAAGIAKEGGPIGVMLHEHEHGRRLIADIRKSMGGTTPAVPDTKAFQHGVEAYSALLRQHIAKENDVLFPMADNILSSDADNELFARFEQLEAERIGIGKHEEFHALLDALKEKYL